MLHASKYILLQGKHQRNVLTKYLKTVVVYLNPNSCGSLPRNKKQVANVKSPKCDVRDPLFAVIEQCKNEESQVERNVQGAPDAMCVIASNRQW